ncbi:hypothetical protein M0638_17230 [Roseomonas sp. NAR14]|uniref:Autotransporter domain-containing protein n=1 Tax=Roseomonas acroporae TaxID=2937791 RepID=A0A9X2BYK3_9PROT|nr:hypothetical protein [Roseomonas acroporae]MCK8786120.1 hypothetical protein [Roseomonas acroporae]
MAAARRLATAIGLAILSPAAMAQTPFDEFRRELRTLRLGNTLQALSVFGGTPGIGAANYSADGLDISTYKLPVAHGFAPFGHPYLNRIAPYVELTLGYLGARAGGTITLDPLPATALRTDFRTYTALAGGGFELLLTEEVRVRPILLLGYSRVEADTRFGGPLAGTLESLTGGILGRIRSDNAMIGGALEIAYDHRFAGDLRLRGKLRYNQIHASAYSASDGVFKSDGTFGAGTLRLELNGPTGRQMFGRELRWLGYTGGTVFTGPRRSALGFGEFAEFGGGLELVDRNVVRGVEGVALRGSGIVGNGVTGWSVGLSLAF